MSERVNDMPGERRDIQGTLADIRVDVATIKERTETLTTTVKEVKDRLELGVFREEYERRHKQLEDETVAARKEADFVRDDWLRQQGASRVWRIVFSSCLALLGLVEVFFRH
jgi:DNA-binding transcriptional regulator YbjK